MNLTKIFLLHGLVSVLLLLFPIAVNSQTTLPENWQEQIKKLVADAAEEDGPGLSVSIAFADQPVYSTFRGLSTLEHQIPLQSNSRFQTGDLCNQFVAFGLLRLVKQGKIDLEEEIQTYLPEFARFTQPVLIKHLITHTHGLPNAGNLQRLAGWGNGAGISTRQLLGLVSHHPSLAFTPGSQFNYDNTGFLIAAEIIETVSGLSFPDYMKETVFKPLGMFDTYFSADRSEIDPLRTRPYLLGRDGYIYGSLNYHQLPPSNLYSSTKDLGKWGSFLNTPTPEYASVVNELDRIVDPTDEDLANIARGQFVEPYRGLRRYFQMGLAYGNMSYISRFPDQNLTVVVLSNDIGFRASQVGDQIADLLLSRLMEPQTEEAVEASDTQSQGEVSPVAEVVLQSYVGSYWEADAQYARSIYLKEDTLFYSRGSGQDNPLLAINDTLFRLGNTGNNSILISFSGDLMELNVNDSYSYHFEAYVAPVLKQEELDALVGKYYNLKLGVTYELTQQNGDLFLYHPRLGSIHLQPFDKNNFITDHWYLAQVRFLFGRNGRVAFAEISSSDISGVLIYPIPD